jgi:SagB-type dehydrogenase family enzyme
MPKISEQIHPLVDHIVSLEPGCYQYDPLNHQLVLLRPWGQTVQQAAVDIYRKAPPGEIPDVTFANTARMMRLTYKYESIPHIVFLKGVGVLCQTLYLTAWTMGFAPCAVGSGASALIAFTSELSPFLEPQIGEWMLSTAT